MCNLKADRDALELPVVVLPARGVILARITLGTHTRILKHQRDLVDLGSEAGALLVCQLAVGDRDADDLNSTSISRKLSRKH